MPDFQSMGGNDMAAGLFLVRSLGASGHDRNMATHHFGWLKSRLLLSRLHPIWKPSGRRKPFDADMHGSHSLPWATAR